MVNISVLMPIKELSEFTTQSINSILTQSFKNFEIIIIIDGNFKQINNFLQNNYANYIKSNKIILIDNLKNLGITKSLNVGIKFCNGKYIVRNDSDDISYPDRLKEQFELIISNNDYKIITCNYRLIDNNHKLIRNKKVKNINKYKLFNYLNPIAHSSVLFEKSFIDSLNNYDENMYTSQDFELWSKAFLANPNCIGVINKTYIDIRIHENTISNTKSLLQSKNSVLICMRNRHPFKKNYFINQKLDHIYENKNILFDSKILVDLEALCFCYLGYNQFTLKGLTKLLLIFKIIKIYFFHKGLAYRYLISLFNK